jgi:hypothetical protein
MQWVAPEVLEQYWGGQVTIYSVFCTQNTPVSTFSSFVMYCTLLCYRSVLSPLSAWRLERRWSNSIIVSCTKLYKIGLSDRFIVHQFILRQFIFPLVASLATQKPVFR